MAQTTHDRYPLVGPLELEEMELYHPKTWLGKYVFSQDAKYIAIQYSLTAIAIGVVALGLSVVMRLQLGFPNTFSFIDPSNYLQAVTMHGMIMVIYLLTALFLGGFGNYLIPLMVGARDMVFPYVNMLSYWIYLLAVLLLVASFFVPGGATGAGWTLYPPQAVSPGTPGIDGGIILMLLSLIVFIIGFTMGGLNYVTTVLQARTRGMTLMRMPLSVWGIFMATVLALLAFPALLVSCIMMLLDRTLGTSFFMPAMQSLGDQTAYNGGSPILWQHLFWFFGHPEVYIVALPAFGIVSDLVATHARKNIFGYRMMVWAILAIGGLSFVVWAHHMYVSGMNPYFGFFFATTTLIIAVPTALKVYNWVLTLWRGNIRLTVPMLFTIGFIFTFINGGLTGLFLGNVTVDVPLSDTYFVIGHFHMVMAVSPVLVIFGAIYHWFPKITGRMFHEGLGKAHFWVTFLGTYAIYYPMHYIGFEGVPRRYFAYGDTAFMSDTVQDVNVAITIAAIIVALGQLLFFYNMFRSTFSGPKADSNPWGATTLEWQTPHTPPHHGNFGDELPIVYRWAYDYGVPGAKEDFIPQNVPPDDERVAYDSDRHPEVDPHSDPLEPERDKP
jgi:cytochrome c oxidase subunit 1